MKTRTIALTFLAAALAGALLAQAQSNVYRWTDKDGKVQFSDSPLPPMRRTRRRSAWAAAATRTRSFRMQPRSPSGAIR